MPPLKITLSSLPPNAFSSFHILHQACSEARKKKQGHEQNSVIRYKDDEGEWITIRDDEDLEAAKPLVSEKGWVLIDEEHDLDDEWEVMSDECEELEERGEGEEKREEEKEEVGEGEKGEGEGEIAPSFVDIGESGESEVARAREEEEEEEKGESKEGEVEEENKEEVKEDDDKEKEAGEEEEEEEVVVVVEKEEAEEPASSTASADVKEPTPPLPVAGESESCIESVISSSSEESGAKEEEEPVRPVSPPAVGAGLPVNTSEAVPPASRESDRCTVAEALARADSVFEKEAELERRFQRLVAGTGPHREEVRPVSIESESEYSVIDAVPEGSEGGEIFVADPVRGFSGESISSIPEGIVHGRVVEEPDSDEDIPVISSIVGFPPPEQQPHPQAGEAAPTGKFVWNGQGWMPKEPERVPIINESGEGSGIDGCATAASAAPFGRSMQKSSVRMSARGEGEENSLSSSIISGLKKFDQQEEDEKLAKELYRKEREGKGEPAAAVQRRRGAAPIPVAQHEGLSSLSESVMIDISRGEQEKRDLEYARALQQEEEGGKATGVGFASGAAPRREREERRRRVAEEEEEPLVTTSDMLAVKKAQEEADHKLAVALAQEGSDQEERDREYAFKLAQECGDIKAQIELMNRAQRKTEAKEKGEVAPKEWSFAIRRV
eukprot:CAMPEP_0113918256 /NCGR_PEP_ID=MMETSP0780_2-20120614/33237_1 /TAXON_ID=652834 /ORGANISM="Palpitomonas bilix" /LENGTH=668 /DNA_ID=CAMNT_0000918017 /DNA_START=112 /DNA_END=2118 /DNA_ORIENTATION=+ /assembly_acc=CAM_ASM_000599